MFFFGYFCVLFIHSQSFGEVWGHFEQNRFLTPKLIQRMQSLYQFFLCHFWLLYHDNELQRSHIAFKLAGDQFQSLCYTFGAYMGPYKAKNCVFYSKNDQNQQKTPKIGIGGSLEGQKSHIQILDMDKSSRMLLVHRQI